MRAVMNGIVVADSDATITIEGNRYFPPDSVRWDLLTPSTTTSRCFWKGKAHYWSVDVDGVHATDVAWSYPQPWPLARPIAGYVAFWGGVQIAT